VSGLLPPGADPIPTEVEAEEPIVIDVTGTVPRAASQSGATSSRRMWRRFRKNKIAMVAVGFIVFLILVAILAPALAPYDPDELDLQNTLAEPSSEHWLGTDDLGRDTLSRLIYATRLSIRATAVTMLLAIVVAVPLGLIAGYFRGWSDAIIGRTTDALFTFPPIVMGISIVALLGPSITNLSIAMAIVFIPGLVRLTRGQVLAVREEVYIEASRSVGTGSARILRTHILPNVASPVIVSVSASFGYILLLESSLSFLGLGEPPPAASWGGMLQRAYQSVFVAPLQIVWPGLAIAFAVLAFNLLGDGLRDAMGRESVRVSRRSLRTTRRPTRDVAAAAQAFRDDVDRLTGGAGATNEPAPVLEVENLAVEFITPEGWVRVVDDVSFTVRPGETVGLVGESGSGKTVSVLAVMGLLPEGQGRVAGGSAKLGGRDLIGLDDKALRKVQGSDVAMIFQEPMTSLNPAFTIGNQIAESVRAHRRVSKKEAWRRAVEMLELVGIPDAAQRVNEYPHNFSGGMRQRAMIAMALACDPKVLIADEPTTALDVTIQAQILELLRRLQRELGMAIVFVTHDLGVVAEICDLVAVLYGGQTVERAAVDDLFARPRHPYTEALMASIPQAAPPGDHLRVIPGVVPRPDEMPAGCHFHPRCEYAQPRCAEAPIGVTVLGPGAEVRCVRHDELALVAPALHSRSEAPSSTAEGRAPLLMVRGLRHEFPIRKGIMRHTVGVVKAVDDVSFEIAPGETLGLVGESGSGKSTTGRALLRLIEPTAGEIEFDRTNVTRVKGKELRRLRESMQIVFQDPYSSLDPRRTIAESVGEPFAVHRGMGRKERDARVGDLLETVGLGRHLVHRYPYEFSGGQRQRIAIARALALNPRLLVCDEPVSSLDVSTQSQVINLFVDLQDRLGLAYLFIAHDLSVVSHISDRIAVMYLGRIVEVGPAAQVVDFPRHPYTLALLSAIPVPDPAEQRRRARIVLRGDIPSPANPPSGCRFHTRCVYAMDICREVDPPPYTTSVGTTAWCHLHTAGPILGGEPVTLLPTGARADPAAAESSVA
jgi:peptide/nickel transport system ATP-binding protein